MGDPFWAAYTNMRGARQNMLAREAGGMIADGDMTGARNALLRGGQIDAGFKVDDQIGADRKAKAEAASRWAQGLGRMMEDPRYAADPLGAYDAARPFAERLGLDPREVEADRQLFARDPKGYATMLMEKAKEEAARIVAPGSHLVGDDGRVIFSAPFAPQYRTVGEGQSLVEVGGENGNPIPGGTPGFNPSAAISELEAGGARVTSTTRTPERNRAVGGVPTSRHMSGEAVDLTPGPGQTMAQLAQEARRKFPNARVINEGDHVHVQWGSGGAKAQGGARVVAAGAPKRQGHIATAQEKAALGLPADAPYWIDGDGKPTAVSGEKPNKPLTEYQGKSVEYMNAALSANDRLNDLAARKLYKPRTPTDSLFSKPDKNGNVRLVLRSDEDRQFMQAAKEWLAPILRKDTGAAVTDGELATYMDIYIPKYEDSPRVMWQKAQARDAKMRALYGANKAAYDGTFGAPGRWKVLTDPRAARGGKGGSSQPRPKTQGNGWKVLGVE